jgi:hypothetical protein
MIFLYLMLFMNRFHNDPRVGGVIFGLGPLVITPVKVVGLLVVLFALVARRPPDAAPRRPDAIPLIFLAFCVIPFLEIILLQLPLPTDSISSLISLVLFLIAIRLLVTTDRRMLTTIRALILTSAFASLWVYKQHFLNHLSNPGGVEQDSNYEALTLVTGIPLAVWLTSNDISKSWRRLGLASATLMGGAVVLTESRAGLIAAGIMGVSAILYARRKLLTLMAVVGAGALIVVLAPAGLSERFRSIKITGGATNGAEVSTRTHVELARAGLNMMWSHPVLGVGLERFKKVAPDYNPDLLSTAGRRYIAHDTYVQIGAETGLFRLFLFLVLVVLAIHNCGAASTSGHQQMASLGLAIRLALIAFCVAAASVTAEYVVTFWIILFLSQNLRDITLSLKPISEPIRMASGPLPTAVAARSV